MGSRPPHPYADIEAVLAWVETLGGFQIEVRQEGRVYAVLRFRAREPEGSSAIVDMWPPNRVLYATRLVAFVRDHRGDADELHNPSAPQRDFPEGDEDDVDPHEEDE